MRSTLRLLASVKAARYLEPGVPTGLTGVFTHNSPRATLLYLYGATLDRLKAFPESSIYRQSIEALTKHRLAIVEAAVPPGHAEWTAKAKKLMAERPELAGDLTQLHGGEGETVTVSGRTFLLGKRQDQGDVRYEEWDGVETIPFYTGGKAGDAQELTAESLNKLASDQKDANEASGPKLEPEPQLTSDQISEIENNIGAGLIEEVISVAEGELNLIDVMETAKVWEQLEEKPAEGQWTYFERH